MFYRNRLALALAAVGASSLHATVTITSFTPSAGSPQLLGTEVTWTATATDSNAGPLTFQYNVAYNKGTFGLARDFYPGTLASGIWTGPAFNWTTISGEGNYQIQVVAEDFGSGETATLTVPFVLSPVSTAGSFVVTPAANPLVALASAPACPSGSQFRLTLQKVGATLVNKSNWKNCVPQLTSNMYAAGMKPSSTYTINYQVDTGGTVVNGPKPVNFTTGALPSGLTFPKCSVITPPGPDADADQTILHAFLTLGSDSTFLPTATDRSGNILWYYSSYDAARQSILTRPLTGGYMLTLQTGYYWNPNVLSGGQYLREIDLAGNTQRETNIGVLQQELLAMGATDFGSCGAVPLPAAVGAACMGTMHHEAIRLPNGYTAQIVDIEKIFPPGTQGDTTGLNVDIIGDGVLVLNENFQVVWYFDTFQHDSGPPQLNINRPAVLGEACTSAEPPCPNLFLAGTPGVTTLANDWIHANSLYFDSSTGDILVSSRHQDWVFNIDYSNGTGNGNVLWIMGNAGAFTFNNIYNDPWPWFSHQHDVGYANTATGLLTIFDNGNTRVSPPPLGTGSGNSRGMALTVDLATMTVTPVLSQDLGYYGLALGSAQLLDNGNYWFQPGTVPPTSQSYSLELQPTAAPDATTIYDLQAPTSYRSWLMPNLYAPPPQ
jgi:hypothetical protein